MALTTERIVGHMLEVEASETAGTPLTKWNEFEVTLNEKTEDAGTSDSPLDEEVATKKWVEGRATGLLGVANNGATLPMPGDVINIGAKSEGVSVLPDLTSYGTIRVKAPVKYNFKTGPASFEFAFRSGRLNGAI